jgi:hypothetical protein
MLNCNSCDYFSMQKGKKLCEFSDHLFIKNPLDMDKYPCQDLNYDSYLLRIEKKEDIDIVA